MNDLTRSNTYKDTQAQLDLICEVLLPAIE